MNDRAQLAASGPRAANATLSIGSALFISLLIVAGLAALALWPSGAWAPPRRPGLGAPIVFDEFVNAPPAPNPSEPVAH